MRKITSCMILAAVCCYLWYALLPTWLNFSIPTGGWDWLDFTGVIISVYIAVWGIREQIKDNHDLMVKQQQLSVVPYLDVNAYSAFDKLAFNNSFRTFEDSNKKLTNNGYTIIRDAEKNMPDGFCPTINVRIKNRGLSTAFKTVVLLYELKSVKGLPSLDELHNRIVEGFYDSNKIVYEQFEYLEDGKTLKSDWIISPQYNLGINDEEFNLVFDTSKIGGKYHTILKFQFEDVYKNQYYQLMYLYFDSKQCAALPVSELYAINNEENID